jgi:hypothetical protein
MEKARPGDLLGPSGNSEDEDDDDETAGPFGATRRALNIS